MIFWIDAHISPSIAYWINETFPGNEAVSFRALGLRDAKDMEVFTAARKKNVILISKDSDFRNLIHKHGTPPSLIWITCGNTSNEKLKTILSFAFSKALRLLEKGEAIVEINDKLTK
jgi:predicted nuclease of predicted toxin-antitoxin system